jgi:hypothetical protein
VQREYPKLDDLMSVYQSVSVPSSLRFTGRYAR